MADDPKPADSVHIDGIADDGTTLAFFDQHFGEVLSNIERVEERMITVIRTQQQREVDQGNALQEIRLMILDVLTRVKNMETKIALLKSKA